MDPKTLAAASAVLDRHFGPSGGEPAPAPVAEVAPEPVEQASAVEPVEPTPTPAAEEVTTPAATDVDPAADLGASFKLDDVPEEYREHVERYVRMTHGAFTRKSQTVAQQRKEAEAAIALQAKLNDPETRDEALRELLSTSGWSVMEDEPTAASATAEVEEGTTPEPAAAVTTDPDLAARIEKIEQAQAAATAAQAAEQREEYLDAVQDVIDEGMEELRSELGLDDVPAHVKELVLGFAKQLPAVEGLWPDMKGAAARYQELRAAEIQAYVATKRAPDVNAAGSAGTPKFNPKDRKERLAAMEAIAGRHSA